MIYNQSAYDDAYTTARACLLSLALLSGPTVAWHYRSILMHLDAIHGWPVGDHTLPGYRWELLARLENAIEDMINSGGAQQPLAAILQAALTAEM